MSEKIIPIGEKFSMIQVDKVGDEGFGACPYGNGKIFTSKGKNPQYEDVSIATTICPDATSTSPVEPATCEQLHRKCVLWGKRVRVVVGGVFKKADLFVGKPY